MYLSTNLHPSLTIHHAIFTHYHTLHHSSLPTTNSSPIHQPLLPFYLYLNLFLYAIRPLTLFFLCILVMFLEINCPPLFTTVLCSLVDVFACSLADLLLGFYVAFHCLVFYLCSLCEGLTLYYCTCMAVGSAYILINGVGYAVFTESTSYHE